MTAFYDIWCKIQQDNYDYYNPTGTSSGCSVYITDDYVFKQCSNQYQDLWKSKEIIDYLYSMGISVPKVHFYSKSDNFVVYERINGKNLIDVDDSSYAYKSGKILRDIHKNRFQGFGDIVFEDSQITGGKIDSLSEYVDSTINVTDSYMPDNSIFQDLFDQVKQEIVNLDYRDLDSCICHFDYNMHNIICTDNKCYVIDFMGSEMSLPAIDVINTYIGMIQEDKSKDFRSEFLDGYGKQTRDLSDIGIRIGVILKIGMYAYWEKEEVTNDRYRLDSCKNNLISFINNYIHT